jgi:SPP1 gp7 family putative phage head morphogenesis protein
MHDSVQVHHLSENALMLLNPHAGCTCSDCKAITDAPRVELSDIVEQNVIEAFDEAWQYVETEDVHSDETFRNSLISAYGAAGTLAYASVSENASGEGAGVGVSFDFVHSGVKQDLENEAGNRVKGIENTTRELLRKELAEAYANAENVDSWVKRIQKVMDIPEWRAEMIARTEIAWAFNRANNAAMKEAGVTRVRYLAVIDSRTCPVCKEDHNKIFDLSNAPQPPRHPRCRCQLLSEL